MLKAFKMSRVDKLVGIAIGSLVWFLGWFYLMTFITSYFIPLDK